MASPAGDSLETALDELYGSDPAEFVAIRKQIAARLRGDGERVAAKAVLAARRPTAAAGALNQLARQEPATITTLLERSADLRDAFRRSRDEVRAATAAHRDALRTAADGAVALLPSRSDSARSQIQSTLHAASVDAEVARLLRAGRLEKEMTGPSGFGETESSVPTDNDTPPAPRGRHLRLAPTLASDLPSAKTQPSATDERVDERRRVASERLAHEVAKREGQEREERERVEAAAREAQQAEARRAELQAALETAEAEATDAAAELETARRIERDLESRLQVAQDHRARAEARDQAARAAVAEVRATLDLKPSSDIPQGEPSV
ncbi:MAG: hypothetical protein ABIP21_06640 [Acidimicrobiia bacterium]